MSTEALIEGILFAMGDSVSREELAAALQIPEKEVENAVGKLEDRYREEKRGLMILTLEDRYQLAAGPACTEALTRLSALPKRQTITPAQMETLAIVAYRQPVTRAEIAKIRGVNSDRAVNRLVEVGLVCENGRLEAPGKPILLGTTEEFLRRFGLSSLGELPELEPEEEGSLQEEAEEEIREKVDVSV